MCKIWHIPSRLLPIRSMRLPLRSGWVRGLLATFIAALVAALVAGRIAEHRTLAALASSTAQDARLRAALLDSEIARLRLVPLALADDRDVVAALDGAAISPTTLGRKLESLARITGAAAIYLIAPDGKAIAASNWRSPQSFVGSDYSFRRYFREARTFGAASQFALGTVSRRPGLYLARRTSKGGVIVVKLEFDRLEAEWRRAGGITYVGDRTGLVLVTSRPDWRFAASKPVAPAAFARFRADASLATRAPRPLPIEPAADGRRMLVAGVPFVGQASATTQAGWTLVLLQPAGPTIQPVKRAAALGAALAVAALVALSWGLRQRALLIRRRTTELEQAVAERTAALRHEMEERAASEARAAELREGLRQANRLATLGQVTASVAHETAQPVAAIRTYAQTSETLLDRGDMDQVRANLTAIGRLADRIGAVTAELRGFSRRKAGASRPVQLAEVLDGAFLILKDQLRAVTLDVPPVDPALAVLGGKVRLEQVLVNLVQNAIEALAGRESGRITLQIAADADTVRLTIADNGPGIPQHVAERLFTPFVTSRPNGLGLGLVIAQEIMIDFGGSLRFLPSEAGARFELTLRRA